MKDLPRRNPQSSTRPPGRLGPSLFGFALVAVLAFGVAPEAAAQTGTIRGRVVAEGTQQPLASVQIFVLGTRLGTLTNSSGEFILVNVPAGEADVRAQRLGYGTAGRVVNVQSGETATVTLELAQSAIALDEVVVTGTGVATERRKLGNTIATIGAATIEDKAINTFSEVLQGREPGVVGLPSGGLTGEGTRIRIRGTNTLSQSNEPIVYLNGVRIDNGGGRGPFIGTGGGGMPSRLDDIDPSSIERIEILKGAAAATLYGTEASSGVIQIFTKQGSEGAPRWEIQTEQGMLTYPDVFPHNAGFVASPSEAQRVSDFFGIQVQPYQVFERDFFTPLLETGYTSVYSGSVNGGGGNVTYFASGRYQFEDGPIGAKDLTDVGDVARKAQGNVSVTLRPAEGLQLRVNSMYTQSDNNTINNNNNIYAPFTLAMFGQPQQARCSTPRGGSSEPTGTGQCTGVGRPLGELAFATVRETLQRSTEQQAQHFNGSIAASYRPVDNIGLDVTFGVDMVNQMDVQFAPFGYDLDKFTRNNVAGSRTLSDRNFRQLSLDSRLSWEADPMERISSQFVVGTQGFIERVEIGGSFGRDFPGPGFGVTSAGSYQEALETFSSIVNAGFFAQEQIGWDDWVFGTVGGRYDYNSAFGESAGGAFYPKASLSMIPSSRPGWNRDLLSTFRVRAAIGQSGLQPGAFDQLTTFGAVRSEFGPGVQPSNLGNPNLKPEVSTEWEVGAELGMMQDRVAIEATYWDRTTSDALIDRQFAVSGGFLQRQLDNIGELNGRGLEIGIRGAAVDNDAVRINLFANAAYLDEEITSLGGAPALKVGGSYPRYRNWIREGFAPGAFFGPKLIDAEYPIDIDGDCQPESRDELLAFFATPKPSVTTTSPFRVLVEGGDPRPCGGGGDYLGHYLGKPVPDWAGAFGGDMDFLRNFTLSTLFEYKAGNYQVHNLTHAFRRAHPFLGGNLEGGVQARATLADPSSTPEERLEAARVWVTEYVALSPYDGLNEIEDADFVRWRELSLTYRLPQGTARRLGATNMALSVTGRNIALWTKYSGTDPETNLLGRTGSGLSDQATGIDAFGFPLPRRLTFSARVGF